MANYEWDLDKLIKEREEIRQKLEIYTELFDRYSDMIENANIKIALNSKVISIPSGIKLLKKQFYDIIAPNRIELVTSSTEIAKDYFFPFINTHFSTLPLSHDELIEETRQLFKQLSNKDFLDSFDYFTNPKNQLLHVKYHKKLLTDCQGLSYVDSYKQVCYGLIARRNTIEDIITVGHELFHMIIRKQEKPLFNYSSKTVYEEVEGYFANLIFCNLLMQDKKYNADEIEQMNTIDLQSTIDSIICTFIAENSISMIDESGNIDYQNLNSLLQQNNIKIPVKKENIDYFISSSLEENVNQSISFFIALDLYHEWLKDPEKAFEHLIQIPNLEGEKPKYDLEQIGVTFFEDGYQNLGNHCKRLLKQPKRKS